MITSPDGSTPVGSTPTPEPVDRAEEIKPKPDIFDPFDPEGLKLSQEFLDQSMATMVWNTIPVEKPNDQEFLRSHPDESYQFKAALLTHHEERGARYLIHPVFLPHIGNIKYHLEQLFLYVTRQGKVAFWPIKVPKDNRENTWLQSAYGAVETAMTDWVCVTSNPRTKMYVTSKAQGNFPEPDWRKILQGKNLFDLLRIAFNDRVITTELHPLIQKLRGAI
jgi:hypothetical protein